MLPNILDPALGPEDWEPRRRQILKLFEENVFGRRPDLPYQVQSRLLDTRSACGGAALRESYEVTVQTSRGSAAMELSVVLPQAEAPIPCVLMISNHDRQTRQTQPPDMSAMKKVLAEAPAPWRESTVKMMREMTQGGTLNPSLLDIHTDEDQGYWPVRTIVHSGRVAACFYASQAQSDAPSSFPESLAALFLDPDLPRPADGWGTLGVWAFAASVMVSVQAEHPRIDPARVSVAGHSRGGKTALWCAAQDPRVHAVLVNNSGCTGAAVSRGKSGEVVASICAMFPHWFCPNYSRYAWHEEEMPFDQHMLLAAVAPRLCYVTSGSEDLWSDPDAEWRGTQAAGAVWELFGYPALPQSPPKPNSGYRESGIGYHLRKGGHDLTKWDWQQFLAFLDARDG